MERRGKRKESVNRINTRPAGSGGAVSCPLRTPQLLPESCGPSLDNFMKGGVNVLGHAGGISADVEAGAVFQPISRALRLPGP